MRIKTGIGVGGAQIFDTSGIQDAYYKQYLQKQKQDQAYAEDLANNLAKYDTTGLTPDDAKYADKLYSDLKNKYLQVNIKDPKERALANAELKSGMQKIKDFTYNAKKFPLDRQKIGEEFGKNRFMYPDDVIKSFDKNVKDKPYYQVMQSGFGDINQLLTKRNPDNSFVEKGNKEFDEALNKAAIVNTSGFKTVDLKDDKGKMYRASSYSTTPEVAKKIALGILNKDDSTKSSYYYNFMKDNPNVEPNDAVVADYIVKQGEARRPSNPYTFQDKFKPVSEEKKTGGGRSSDVDLEVVQPIELNIPFARGKGVVNVKDYIKLPMAKQNFAGSGYIDMNTGQPSTGKLESSNDYEVVGVGNFPIVTKGNFKGSLSQPKYSKENPNSVELKPMVHVQKIKDGLIRDLLIPYDRLPSSKKTSKKLSNFVPQTTTQSQPKPTNTTNKKYSDIQEKGILAVMNNNKGITREQAISALIEKGKLPK
jgi:hypothetical protein